MLVTPLPPIIPAACLLATLGPHRALPTLRLFGSSALRLFGEEHFTGEGGRRLIAGNALHADLTPETAIGGFFGFVLCALGQDVGFPVPAGGAGMLSGALVRRLETRGGTVE